MTDVLVVGGGPSGSTVAGLLARRGWRVTIVDRARFPRPKACGEFVNPGAVRLLHEIGLAGPVRSLDPAAIDGWLLSDETGATATARFGDGVCGWGLARSRLDAALLDAARTSGAEVLQGVRVTDLTLGPAPRAVGTTDGGRWEARARMLIGADGLRSIVARKAGAVRRKPRLRKFSVTCHLRFENPVPGTTGRLRISDRRTVGAAPLSPDRSVWNVTVVGDPQRDGPAVSDDRLAYLQDALRSAGVFRERVAAVVGGPWTSGPFDRPVAPPTGPGYLLVGDAAGYYDPLTGQGIYRALRSGQLAATAVDRWLRVEAGGHESPRGYARALKRAFMSGRTVQHAVEAVIRATPSRRLMFRRLAARPQAASALLRVTGDLAPARSLMDPRSWGPLLVPGATGEPGTGDGVPLE